MRISRILLLFFISVAGMANSQELDVTINIVDEQNKPIANAAIEIALDTKRSNTKGTSRFELAKQDVYQFNISAPGYYNRVHHFGYTELQQQPTIQIELIKQQAGRVMMAFGGDVMMGRRYLAPYFNDPVLITKNNTLDEAKKIVKHMKPYLSLADFAAVNLESQVAHSEPKQRASKLVTFYSQPEVVDALKWAGIDYVTLGNNHTYDYLDEGLTSTLQILNDKKLPFSGAGFTEEEALLPYVLHAKDTEYAMLGYVGWQGSKRIKQTATSEQGGAAFGSMQNIQQGVLFAKKANQLPVVQYHGSLEYKNEPTGVTEQRLKSAIDSGAVMAVAHHPHVTQGLELYNDKLIAYSMGNFIFDQNFSATQLSFLLYVWLDAGEFHRAEVVPVYVKGYKPTPAVGETRLRVLKRLMALSAKRNTEIQAMAGVGVISTQSSNTVQKQNISLMPARSKIQRLAFPSADSQLMSVALPLESQRYRLGTNLINGSDFEYFKSFETTEQGLIYERETSTFNSYGYQSNHSLGLLIESKGSQEIAMKHFRRVYRASNPMTVKLDLQAKQDVKVNIYWQGRKTRQKLFDAFENSPKQLISSMDIKGKADWQSLEVDFNSPRIGYRSFRVLVELVNQAGEATQIDIDNFSLLQWQTAFSRAEKPMLIDADARMTNYIGFSETSQQKVKLTFN